jgi:hypothetical protein
VTARPQLDYDPCRMRHTIATTARRFAGRLIACLAAFALIVGLVVVAVHVHPAPDRVASPASDTEKAPAKRGAPGLQHDCALCTGLAVAKTLAAPPDPLRVAAPHAVALVLATPAALHTPRPVVTAGTGPRGPPAV